MNEEILDQVFRLYCKPTGKIIDILLLGILKSSSARYHGNAFRLDVGASLSVSRLRLPSSARQPL